MKVGVIKPFTPPCIECDGETVKKVRRENGRKKVYFICTVCHVEHPGVDYHRNRELLGGIRYRVRTHELRDTFRTQCHQAHRYAGFDMDVAEFMMQHDIDPLKYDKIMRDVPGAKAEFRKALPFLNVLSEEPLKIERCEVDDRFADLQREVAELKRLIREEAEWVLPRLTKRRG